MSNVTGQIGTDAVMLENAATEATLQLLLQATLATTKAQKDAISGLAKNSGLDPKKVEETGNQMNALGKAAFYTGAVLGGLTNAVDTLAKKFNEASNVMGVFTSGEGSISQVYKSMDRLFPGIGAVATSFVKLAEFQEKQLAAYQDLTNSGISFGGSLTNLRMAASNTYMTMDQFSNLMKNNSAALSKMGGTVDDGARAFVNMSHSLLSSKAGDNLRALGYTSEQVNQGLLDYIAISGGRTKEELSNTKALTQSATEYMTELDALAEITGKSRKEQEDAAKEAAANQAIQAKLQTMSEEERKKYEIARAEAFARGGKGAQDALNSALLGFPPMTKAAQEYTAVAGNMNKVTMDQSRAITDSTKSVNDLKRGAAAYNEAAIKDKEKLGKTGDALIMQGGVFADIIGSIYGTAIRAVASGADTTAKAQKQVDDVAAKQKEREASQAAAAAESTKHIQEMGQAILNNLLPIVEKLMPVINAVVSGMASVVEWISKVPGLFEGLVIAIGGLVVAYNVQKAVMAAQSVLGFGGRGGGGGLAGAVEGAVGGGPKGGGGAGGVIGGVAEGAGKLGPALSSIGKGAGGLIQGFLEGLAAGLTAFADPLILVGAGVFAGSVAIIAVGIGAAAVVIGESLPFMAKGLQSFDKVNGNNLISVGEGLGALALGFAAFGAGAVMGSIGSLIGTMVDGIGSLFGGKTPIQKMIDFGNAPIDAKKVKENAEAFVAFSNAMASYRGGPTNDIIGHISNGITRMFNVRLPLKQMEDFAKITIDPRKVKGNAEAFVAFSHAMAAYKGSPASPGILSAMADSIRASFKVPLPLDQFKQFSGITLGPNAGENAKAFADFATGMAAISNSSPGVGGAMSEAMAGWFAKTPVDKFVDFTNLPINAANAKNNAAAFTDFSNAMSNFKGIGGSADLGGGFFSNDVLDNLQKFSNLELGKNTQTNAEAFTAFSNAMSNFKGIGGSADLGGGFFSNDVLDNLQRFSELKLGDNATANANTLKSIGDGMDASAKNISAFSTSLSDLLKTDITQLDKLAASMSKLKESVQPDQKQDAFQGFIDTSVKGFLSSFGMDANPSSGASNAAGLPPISQTAQDFAAGNVGGIGKTLDPTEMLQRELQTLNKHTMEIVKAMRDTSDNTKKTASVLASNGNLFKAM